jgi:PBSX family phage terminase large subunit
MPRKPAQLAPPFVATPKQLELARAWHDPANHVVLIGGAIRSGKTQAAGRLLVETAIAQPAQYLVSRLTYRELRDSTQKAMLHGDGALPPLIPPEAVEYYRASDELVRLRNGSEILFRSLDEPSKLLNLTLGGILIDQIEELDEGPEGERLFDTLLGRLSDPRGPRKLIAVANPGSLTHWVYRRLVDEKTRDAGTAYVHVELADNAGNLPPDYVARMEASKETRPHWFKSFVKGLWGSFEGAAYEEFDPGLHVVEPFLIPDAWERYEAMDHGAANPTSWAPVAVDHDGNQIVFDLYYSPGLVSAHAAAIKARRSPALSGAAPSGLNWWRRQDDWGDFEEHYCYADPSIRANHGLSSRMGIPASVLTEYREHGITGLLMANNDRAAGYARLLELIHPDPKRPFPSWHPRTGEYGSPRIFVFKSCEQVVAQLQSAPIATDGSDAGEAVDPKWEGAHGHAHAMLRYGVMSRPAPSALPEPEPTDERAFEARRKWQALLAHDERVREDAEGRNRSRYVNV